MELIHGFSPVARPDARMLILGSMPGKKSLAEKKYYAHPRNSFWKIAGKLFQFDSGAPYDQRILSLINSRVALWDVMATCTRSSSLDSDIVESTIAVNNFEQFFICHPEIRMVFFNGLKAAQSYHKYVQPGLGQDSRVPVMCLPSTSPANAGMTFTDKLKAWQIIVARCQTPKSENRKI